MIDLGFILPTESGVRYLSIDRRAPAGMDLSRESDAINGLICRCSTNSIEAYLRVSST